LRLGGYTGGSEAAKFVVDQMQQPGGHVQIASVYHVEQLRDFGPLIARASITSENEYILFRIERGASIQRH
jgi:hypothetical protein